MMTDWTQFAARVPAGTRVRMDAKIVPMPNDFTSDSLDGFIMRYEDAEEGENQDFPESACEADLDFILWVQPLELMDEWWLDPQRSQYLIDGQWLSYQQIMEG